MQKLLLGLLCVLVFGSTQIMAQNPVKSNLTEKQQLEFDKHFFNALRDKLINDFEGAEEDYKKALSIDKNNANAWFQLSSVLLAQKKSDMAEDACFRAVNLDPKNVWYLTQMAGIYRLRNNFSDAALMQEKLVKLTNNPNDYFDLAESYYNAGNVKKSLDALNRAEKITGPIEKIYLQREHLYLQQNKLSKAIKELDKLIKLYPGVTRYLGMKADVLLANGKQSQALKIYQQILKVEPNNGYALFALADFYKDKGDTSQAFSYFLNGMSSDVEDRRKVEVMIELIPSNFFPNHQKQCIALIDNFIKSSPQSATPYLLNGDLYMAQRDFEEARNQYKKAIDVDPKAAIAWEQLLFCNAQLNKPEFMQKDCELLITINPQNFQAHLFYTFSSYQLKEYNKAVEGALRALNLDALPEERSQLLSTLADAAHYDKRYKLTDSAYTVLLELEPNNALALNNWAYFLCLRKERLDTALIMSARTLELQPGNASYLDTYGWILFVKGEAAKAKTYIEQSLALYPENAEVLQHLAEILESLNEKKLAEEYWQKAIGAGANAEEIKLIKKRYEKR